MKIVRQNPLDDRRCQKLREFELSRNACYEVQR